MNTKLILILAIISTIAFACPPGCATCDGFLCLSCYDHASFDDENQRSCSCDAGYFPTNYSPLVCKESPNTATFNECEYRFAYVASRAPTDILCNDLVEDNTNYVTTSAYLNDESLDEDCLSIINSKLIYFNWGADVKDPKVQTYTFDESLITRSDNNKFISLKMPLISLYNFADGIVEQTTVDGAIIQKIHVAVLYSNERKDIRQNSWILMVYTNRQEVNSVSLNVDKKYSNGCGVGEECIIVQDLTTKIEICENESCSQLKVDTDAPYTVGDYFYFKVSFVDPTYTKWLQKKKVLFRSGNTILNFSEQVEVKYYPAYTTYKLLLIEPSNDAQIQVSSLIVTADPSGRIRRLSSQSSKEATLALQVNVLDAKQSALKFAFVIVNLLLVLLF